MTISECVRSSPGWGVVKSLELIGSGPVGLVRTKNFQFFKRKNPAMDLDRKSVVGRAALTTTVFAAKADIGITSAQAHC